MRILHWKRTTIAEAPDELSKAINKYTTHDSSVQKKGQIDGRRYDVVHFHNLTTRVQHASPTKCIQYHSEPHRVSLSPDGVNKELVIAQYHATLPEYSQCVPVRNIIDFRKDLYSPSVKDDVLKVGFSPSARTNNGYWFNKGYIQTKRILERLRREHPDNFEYDVITAVSLKDCIKRKSQCNVIVDECVTPSYHRSGLEGLALGKYTICSMHDEVEDVMLEAASADDNPFVNVEITDLYSHLKDLLNANIGYVTERGRESRNWMEENWSPEEICQSFIANYE